MHMKLRSANKQIRVASHCLKSEKNSGKLLFNGLAAIQMLLRVDLEFGTCIKKCFLSGTLQSCIILKWAGVLGNSVYLNWNYYTASNNFSETQAHLFVSSFGQGNW